MFKYVLRECRDSFLIDTCYMKSLLMYVCLIVSLFLVFIHVCAFDKRGASVSRRYSEFVFLWDCLVRRYPFRLLPQLPPKRIGRE